jgi:hypothetical protein
MYGMRLRTQHAGLGMTEDVMLPKCEHVQLCTCTRQQMTSLKDQQVCARSLHTFTCRPVHLGVFDMLQSRQYPVNDSSGIDC